MSLLQAIFSEITEARRPPRIPEEDLVMEAGDAAAAFARAGEPGGSMVGVYAFHMSHLARIIRNGDTIVDLGCGPARVLRRLAPLMPECHFVGIELSQAMIAIAQESRDTVGIPNLSLVADDMTRLDSLADSSVDVITSLMALHHLPDPASLSRLFRNCERVLRPGGGLFMLDLGRLRTRVAIDYFVRRSIPPGETYLRRDYRSSLLAAFSEEEIARALPETLRGRVELYSTLISPFMIALRMGRSGEPDKAVLDALQRDSKGLPPARRRDLRELRFFFLLRGLR